MVAKIINKYLQKGIWKQRDLEIVEDDEWINEFIRENPHLNTCKTIWETKYVWLQVDLQKEGSYFKDGWTNIQSKSCMKRFYSHGENWLQWIYFTCDKELLYKHNKIMLN